MKSLIAALVAASFAVSAHSAQVLRDGPLTVFLRDSACDIPAVSALLSLAGPSKAATISYMGQRIKACWSADNTSYLIMDLYGRSSLFPAAIVKKAKSA